MNFKLYSTFIKNVASALMLLAVFATPTQAQDWEQIYERPATNAFYISRSGNFIVSDYVWDLTGGIYVSKNKGKTWTKTNASDYQYNIFVENDEYIFAAGCEARVVRSNDGGVTWETINYKSAVQEALGDQADYAMAYALTIHDGKLFLGEFQGGGIIYSEDNGETWKQTDITSLSYGEPDPKTGKPAVENIYNLVSYNGELYAFGVYFVFRYLPDTNSWEVLRDDSNFMAISAFYGGKLCLGRSVMNYTTEDDFVTTLDKNGEWGRIDHPTGTDDNNIRAMFGDAKGLYVGMASGKFYYTNDGKGWREKSEGLPANITPMNIQVDNDYIYLAAYQDPYASTPHSGIHRIRRAALPLATGIEHAQTADNAVQFNGQSLIFNGKAQQTTIYDLNGRSTSINTSGNTVNIDGLSPGVYLYRSIINGKVVTGKFQKN